MSWKSGSGLLTYIIETVHFHVENAEIRVIMYAEIISAFKAYDCDTYRECLGQDPAFDEVYYMHHPKEEYETND